MKQACPNSPKNAIERSDLEGCAHVVDVQGDRREFILHPWRPTISGIKDQLAATEATSTCCAIPHGAPQDDRWGAADRGGRSFSLQAFVSGVCSSITSERKLCLSHLGDVPSDRSFGSLAGADWPDVLPMG
eukprot:CAMPEP_0172838834 /NCGR_PEP_ID=MMETSP1075-20121228/28147_1 /TAXON_ID=2916 /ORGANISM="Ceratium fusus, Strain PA161109" /LENGTH=130 /DNA_ID=CAMNT_0013682399 /DNA_START=458 /DNA_END=848 /DNA_ORIENTATION=-